MIRLDEVADRLQAEIEAFASDTRIGNAAQFSTLVEKNQTPQVTPAAFVLPGPLQGGQAQAMTGAFVQNFSETVIVVLFVKVAGDARGGRAIDEITPLIRQVVEAVAGWAPEDAVGVFTLANGELVGSQRGHLIYQLNFALNDQLRIQP
ncbi:MAG: hypothetical protein WBA68_02560 [Alteraurantiacibacter sp.]